MLESLQWAKDALRALDARPHEHTIIRVSDLGLAVEDFVL